MNARHAQRKAAGLCVVCGMSPPDSTHVSCAPCRDRRRIEYRQRMSSTSVAIVRKSPVSTKCPNCGKRRVKAGRLRCATCLKKAREGMNRRNARRTAAGKCIRCDMNPHVVNGTRCTACIDYEKRKTAVAREKRRQMRGQCHDCGRPSRAIHCMECRVLARQNKRPVRDRRKTEGLCVMCGVRAPRPERVTCVVCAEKRSQYRKQLRRLRETT